MIKFPCSLCGEAMEVPDSLAGTLLACPKCQHPNPVAAPALPPAYVTHDAPAIVILAYVTAVILLVLGCGFLIVAVMNFDDIPSLRKQIESQKNLNKNIRSLMEQTERWELESQLSQAQLNNATELELRQIGDSWAEKSAIENNRQETSDKNAEALLEAKLDKATNARKYAAEGAWLACLGLLFLFCGSHLSAVHDSRQSLQQIASLLRDKSRT